MPLYEYECTQCGQVEEALQKFSDKPLKKCRHCSGSLRKLISNSSFHLKGTGWYVTDYANKAQPQKGSNAIYATEDGNRSSSILNVCLITNIKMTRNVIERQPKARNEAVNVQSQEAIGDA